MILDPARFNKPSQREMRAMMQVAREFGRAIAQTFINEFLKGDIKDCRDKQQSLKSE